MKYLLTLILLLICCSEETFVPENDAFFQGSHLMTTFEDTTSLSSKPEYLTISTGSNTAQFMWKNNKDEFMNTVLPYDKCRIKFYEENCDTLPQVFPYCKFRWNPGKTFEAVHWQESVVYYVIGIKRSQIQMK